MINAVMISIRSKWCELIANGEKTIEVRKTIPKLETPFKCYIYCTKPKYPHEDFVFIGSGTENARGFYGGGKVIVEFVCDNIETICPENFIVREDAERSLSGSCLTISEAKNYAGWKGKPIWECKDLYAWHISDLKIYDTPKELKDFHRPCTPACNFSEECGGTNETACLFPMTRAPQSWCYVEELK